ncbi:MAG TPA: PilZ domain-containing protein [Thermodesulfobacteriota bacterium]|nr:PilZ domain-containing protein [Deltaproteobacteria bacterium]HNR14544.1 PilZ domain-containing protein [Thermodesulfobacteriota bacterium]HNU70169.1 PilZ domain-containing protein [Thermodesulfobacteriota bacterium]HOC37778.1 PilZ domain-containing protein [Thermodesulfobacteriota bacterium]
MVKQEETQGVFYFPGIVQIRDRNDAEGFYVSQAESRTICGLFIHTDVPLAKGERVLAAITLPHTGEPVFVECEVVWARNAEKGRPGMAVRFINIAEADRRALEVFFRMKSTSQQGD